MPTRAKVTLTVVIVVILLVAALCGYLAVSTFPYRGDKALARVTSAEQPYLAKFNLLQTGMTYDQVMAIMDKPDRETLGRRPTWRVNGSSLNQIAAYFANDKLRKVRWMHIGSFILEK